ncbi:hypothetical protein [Rickettsiella endosymbiont of Dermanyssus gallinae]|uniref:hypothetical protein n=1 Tax=Rickettsiella endosymbiont of Dermanyssus gallinae TaxID=2856608 RepID=UPI001C527227|nr:hypothetical protein [Rickettsiella endosymbiont of Dermanyssus gallinae]
MLLSNAVVKSDFREKYQQQAEFTPPSYSASISGNFLKQLIEPEVAIEKIAPLVGLHPHFSSLDDIYEAINQVTETSGLPITQQVGNGIASLLGFALNPINIALGYGGGLLAKGAIKGISALAPEFLSNVAGKTITKLSTETVGSLGEKALTGSSIAAISLLPQELAESITPENKVDVSHFIKTMSIAGGFGLALGAIPFAASVIRSKFFNHSEAIVTPEEKTWYQDYQKNPNDPELAQRAADILKKNQPDIVINSANKVTVPLLTPNDIKALQSVIPEELLAREDIDNPAVLSDFIQKNALDRLKQNPTLSEGLKGILNELESKGEKGWKPFLSNIINHIDSGSEPLANPNAVKDYLKQRIENQWPDSQRVEQNARDVTERLKAHQDSLKEEITDLSAMASQHVEDSELAKEAQPALKKYQEFKNKTKVFSAFMQCLQGRLT